MVTALTATGGREDPVARLDSLDALRAAGRVTEAEYDAKRATILDDL